jgi:hypothetical protein
MAAMLDSGRPAVKACIVPPTPSPRLTAPVVRDRHFGTMLVKMAAAAKRLKIARVVVVLVGPASRPILVVDDQVVRRAASNTPKPVSLEYSVPDTIKVSIVTVLGALQEVVLVKSVVPIRLRLHDPPSVRRCLAVFLEVTPAALSLGHVPGVSRTADDACRVIA